MYRKLPPKPTSALPGTVEKVRVLCERAAHGEPLWHPGDAQLTDRHGYLPLTNRNGRHILGDLARLLDDAQGWVVVATKARPKSRPRSKAEMVRARKYRRKQA